MRKIKALPNDVRDKIAAGEVVERPASVVKELIDNAIDAKATRIELSLEQGGLKKIVVWDNGIGMDKEDVKVCWKHHMTSKISTIEDLEKIQSLGLRFSSLNIFPLAIKMPP